MQLPASNTIVQLHVGCLFFPVAGVNHPGLNQITGQMSQRICNNYDHAISTSSLGTHWRGKMQFPTIWAVCANVATRVGVLSVFIRQF